MRGTSSLFCCFLSEKRPNGDILERIWAKTLIIQQQFSKNITFFMWGTSSKNENLLINLKRSIDKKKKQNKDDVPRIKNVTF